MDVDSNNTHLICVVFVVVKVGSNPLPEFSLLLHAGNALHHTQHVTVQTQHLGAQHKLHVTEQELHCCYFANGCCSHFTYVYVLSLIHI